MTLQDIRKEKGLKAVFVSEKLGIAFPTLSLWESGKRHIPVDKLLKLADIYGVSIIEIAAAYTETYKGA